MRLRRYERDCPRCGGTGTLGIGTDWFLTQIKRPCSECYGHGTIDVLTDLDGGALVTAGEVDDQLDVDPAGWKDGRP